MNVDDMCKDYKLKFKIKKDKLIKGDIQLGLCFNKNVIGTYLGDRSEYYLYICFIKWNITIGWLLG